jgi:DNA-binding NtrC family response regulator
MRAMAKPIRSDEGDPANAEHDRVRGASTEPQRAVPVPTPRLELTVEVEAGEVRRRHMILDGDVFRVGSHDSNECVLTDPKVSRLHCQLRSTRNGWRVLDTGSLNGTRIDGVSVRDADLPIPECRIEVGDSVIHVRAVVAQNDVSVMRPPAFGALWGTSAVMARLFERLDRIARAEADVLIEGESGTGKELIAAEIVRRSSRADKPFVIVDCGAIARSLIESELFGHARGAFTGADRARVGAFEAANGGTVFLDEIGELPLETQPILLRALAAREVRRMGENETRKVDVRVVAATNRRLEGEVNQGHFREDLYFRLGVLRVDVPPLRERTDDIPLLVAHFLEDLGATDKLPLFTSAVLADMKKHTWPGNVRELRNYVERFVVFDEPELPEARRDSAAPPSFTGPEPDLDVPFRRAKDRTIETFERRYLEALLAWAQGNVSKAARKAHLDRMYLHRLLQRHGLRRGGSLTE